jgi:hypothetical protein
MGAISEDVELSFMRATTDIATIISLLLLLLSTLPLLLLILILLLHLLLYICDSRLDAWLRRVLAVSNWSIFADAVI